MNEIGPDDLIGEEVKETGTDLVSHHRVIADAVFYCVAIVAFCTMCGAIAWAPGEYDARQVEALRHDVGRLQIEVRQLTERLDKVESQRSVPR